MGVGAGKFRPFNRDDSIVGKGKFAQIVSRNLRLTNLQMDRLHHEFTKFSDPVTQKLNLESIFEKYKIPFGFFTNFIFQLYDKTKCGEVDFTQYIIVLWSLLSTEQDSLVSMIFAAFDTERMGSLDITEIDFLVSLIWDYQPPMDVKMAVKHLNKNADSVVTVAEFALLVRHYPYLIQPVVETRELLRKKVVFYRFWEEITQVRHEYFSYKSFFDIIKVLDDSFVKSSLDYLVLQSTTPHKYVAQWKLRAKSKKTNRRGEVDIPYEYIEPPESKFIEVDSHTYVQKPNKEVDVNYQDSFTSHT